VIKSHTKTVDPKSVSDAVLFAYFDELAKVEGLKDVAENLRNVVLEEKNFAEPAIRSAMFPDSP